MSPEWERRPGESAKAFDAFLRYRNLGPERSLNAAYGGKPPGYWSQWSSGYGWPERAAAFDAHCDRVRVDAFEDELRDLGRLKARYALDHFRFLVRRRAKLEAILDKYDAVSVIDRLARKTENGITTVAKEKGLNGAAVAKLAKEARDTGDLIVGAVEIVKPAEAETPSEDIGAKIANQLQKLVDAKRAAVVPEPVVE